MSRNIDSSIYYQVIICPENDQTQVYIIDEKDVSEKMVKRMSEEAGGPPFWCTPGMSSMYYRCQEMAKIEDAMISLYPDPEMCEMGYYITCDGRKNQPYIVSRTFVYYLPDLQV